MARAYWGSYLANLSPPLHDTVRAYAAKHTLACLLARVAGRSPLEYLNAGQRARQARIVLDLIREDIGGVPDLIDAFGAKLVQ